MRDNKTFVAVRANLAGVYMGYIDLSNPSSIPGMITLANARHVWSWDGALGVCGLAEIGPSSGSITSPGTVHLASSDIFMIRVATKAAEARLAKVDPSDVQSH